MRWRDIIKEEIVEAIRPEVMTALRAWGHSTIQDRATKEAALVALQSQLKAFQSQHEVLYRGQGISPDALSQLKTGRSVQLDMHGSLSSWTLDLDTAYTFAEYAGTDAAVVIAKRGLRTFFDFSKFAETLQRLGMLPDVEEYDLADPIKEAEVIVQQPATLMIQPSEIIQWWAFDKRGNQITGQMPHRLRKYSL